MQVFKTFFKIAKKKIPSAMIYVIVFIVINAIVSAQLSSEENSYSNTKLTVCVIDEDNTAASRALTEYIGERHELSHISTDEDTILEGLYYGRIDYVLTIKSGYAENLSKGLTEGLFTNNQVPGAFSSQLLDTQLDEYVRTLSAYITALGNVDEAVSKTGEALNAKTDVEICSFNTKTDADYNTGAYYYVQYLPYMFMSILIAAICPILLVMNDKDMRRRTNCSAVSVSKQTAQIMLGLVVIALGIWLLLLLMMGVIYGFGVFNEKGLLAVLNSFVFLLISAGITLFISVFAPKLNTLNIIANIVALGMSFLCGIFVPQEMLGSEVLAAAKFLPAYWYVKANDMLAGISETAYTAEKYFTYLGIELIFAAVLFAATLLVSRLKSKSKS